MLGIPQYSGLFFLHVFGTLLPVLHPPCQIVYYQLYLRGAKAQSLVWKQRIHSNSFVLWRCSSLHIEICDFYATLYMSSMSAKKKKRKAELPMQKEKTEKNKNGEWERQDALESLTQSLLQELHSCVANSLFAPFVLVKNMWLWKHIPCKTEW